MSDSSALKDADILDLSSDQEEEVSLDEFELQTELLDQEKEEEHERADAEAQSAILDRDGGSVEEQEAGASAEDLKDVKLRIDETALILSRFSEMRDPSKSRSDYMERLLQDVCHYFGYNQELGELMLNLLPPAEAVQLLMANETPRPMTIRVNALKTRRKELIRSLSNRGVKLEALGAWSNVGVTIFESQVPIGATPEYLAGHYMLQSPSSFMPVLAMDPRPKERIVHMCAAPGGKATYSAALMKNSGVLVANDVNKERQRATVGNFHRMGIRNAVITNYDGHDLGKHFKKMDRVLVDAPCTGLGVIARDPSIKAHKTLEDVRNCAKLQKELILEAIDMTKTNGVIVYSTCSISVEENEDIVAYALKKRHVRIVDTGLEFGVDGFYKWRERRFPDEMKLTKRFYPHVHNMDGFYVAKLIKMQAGSKAQTGVKRQAEPSVQKTKKAQR